MPYLFITNEDLVRQIKQEFLTNVTAGLTQAELDKQEDDALRTVLDKLRGRYDTTAITTDKDARVVGWVVTIFLYRLHRRQNGRGIPDNVSADYDATIAWLNDIRDGKEHPNLPPLPDDVNGNMTPGSNDLRSGSESPADNGDFF